jgi:hypothetical protein
MLSELRASLFFVEPANLPPLEGLKVLNVILETVLEKSPALAILDTEGRSSIR